MPDVKPQLKVNTNAIRLIELQKWKKQGGVFLINYTMFTKLMSGQGLKNTKQVTAFQDILSEAPDLVVCDEGHLLKSEKTSTTLSVREIKTKRRVILTGTPLQNNLMEYHCMVSWVKPNLLGTIKEFNNRFGNPIKNGQHKDSTDADVKYMKKRVHVLHNTLDACVQRKDYTVIKSMLKPKRCLL